MVAAQLEGVHCFSVDVEEYFQVNAFERHVSRDQWDGMPSRLDHNLSVLLDALAQHGVTGTFFTLGWVAKRHPDLIRRIAAAGHELASHGWWHRRVPTITPAEFRTELRDSKAILEELTGSPVHGFRAPSFSILPGYEWAFDLLLEEGYRYDSSLFPIVRPGYGNPRAPRVAHLIRRPAGDLLELPLATLSVLGWRIPAAGGGYFRQLPFEVTRRAFAAWGAQGVAAMFYLHPWEVDPEQPRISVGTLTRLRHYGGIDRTRDRLDRLFREFRFTSVARAWGHLFAGPAATPTLS